MNAFWTDWAKDLYDEALDLNRAAEIARAYGSRRLAREIESLANELTFRADANVMRSANDTH